MKRALAAMLEMAMILTWLWPYSCQAQALQPYIEGGAGYIHNMGYENPDMFAAAGVRDTGRGNRWQAEAAAQYDSAAKYIGNGYSLSAQAAGYWCPVPTVELDKMLNRGHLCLGGGAQYVAEVTRQWSKASWRPLLLLRWPYAGWLLTAHVNPSSGSDRQNHEHAFGLTGEYPLTRHLVLVEDATLAIFQPTNQPHAKWLAGGELSSAVRYRF